MIYNNICFGKRWHSCKLYVHYQQDVCMMPNNFTAVGLDWDLKETTLKDDNNDEMPAYCMHAACPLYIFAWDIVTDGWMSDLC